MMLSAYGAVVNSRAFVAFAFSISLTLLICSARAGGRTCQGGWEDCEAVAAHAILSDSLVQMKTHARRGSGHLLVELTQEEQGAKPAILPCPANSLQGALTLEHFLPSTSSSDSSSGPDTTLNAAADIFFDRSSRAQWPVVDMHFHSQPFGGAAVPFDEVIDWLQRAGILFVVLNGIGQRLPADSNCTYYLDCPGTSVRPSLQNDITNAQVVLDAEEKLSGSKGPKVFVSMTFLDLAQPETIIPQMEKLRGQYPDVFHSWAGEVNLVKQALAENDAGFPVTAETIAEWEPFMKVFKEEGIPLALHCDLGSDDDPKHYLDLMSAVLRLYPENKIVWLHLGGLSKELTPERPAQLLRRQESIHSDEHVAILKALLSEHPNLMIDLSWDVLYYAVYSDRVKKESYIDLLNEFPSRFLTGVDFVASEGKTEQDYREQLNLTADILRALDHEAFRHIALGQNFFDLLGLEYQAPKVCFSGTSGAEDQSSTPAAGGAPAEKAPEGPTGQEAPADKAAEAPAGQEAPADKAGEGQDEAAEDPADKAPEAPAGQKAPAEKAPEDQEAPADEGSEEVPADKAAPEGSPAGQEAEDPAGQEAEDPAGQEAPADQAAEGQEAPADEGSEEAPADEGSEDAPADEDSEEAPADEGSEEAAADEGSEEAPADEGSEETAADEGSEQDEGSEEAPADEGSEEAPADKEAEDPAGREAPADKAAEASEEAPADEGTEGAAGKEVPADKAPEGPSADEGDDEVKVEPEEQEPANRAGITPVDDGDGSEEVEEEVEEETPKVKSYPSSSPIAGKPIDDASGKEADLPVATGGAEGELPHSTNRNSMRRITTVLGGIVILLVFVLLGHMILEACVTTEPDPVAGAASSSSSSGSISTSKSRGCTIGQTSFNIVKNIVGEGMLSLPGALAAGTGMFPGACLAIAIGMVTGYTFSLLGRVCEATGGRTHRECCENLEAPVKVQTFLAVVNMLKAGTACWTYAIVIADSCTGFAHYLGFAAKRYAVLIFIAMVVLLPLSVQKLSILSYSSFVGICGEVFILVFMQIRYLDGSYNVGGYYYDKVAADKQPRFGDDDSLNFFSVSMGSFILFGALSTAFMAHYNAPRFYRDMDHKNTQRFNLAVGFAFALCMAIYVWMMSVGYFTFGTNSQGLILNNYSEQDPFAAVARVAISMAVIFGFPLVFTAFRDNALSTFGHTVKDDEASPMFWGCTLVLLGLVVLLASVMSDMGFLNSIGGAILGSLIMFVFPGYLCYTCYHHQRELPAEKQAFHDKELLFSKLIMLLGVFFAVVGGSVVLAKRFTPHVFLSQQTF